jgi:hypothetical protein
VLLNQDTELEDQGGRSGYGRTDFFSGKTFERSRRISLFFYNVYLRLKGIRDENLPSITIVIPVISGSGNLSETIQSLLASRYRRLQVVVVGVAKDQQVAESLPEHSSIKFSEAGPVATAPQAIRSILLRSVDPVFAWLRPGDRLSAGTLNRVGRIFRRSRRIGGVIVRNESSEQSLDSRTEYDFDFLQTQDSTFSAKLFVRRECFWAATKVFAGTEYDCDNWAVALNTARFFRIESLPGGYFGRVGDDDGEGGRTQNIRSKLDASVWRTERLRRAIRKRMSRGTPGTHGNAGNAGKGGPGIDCYVPPLWVKELAGFSPGEMIAFLGCYWGSAGDHGQTIRSVYLDRTTGILALRSGSADLPDEALAKSGLSEEALAKLGLSEEVLAKLGASPHQEYGEWNGTVVVDAGSEMERLAEKLAKGSEILLQKVPELAKAFLGDHLQISVSSDSPGRSGEIESFEHGADLVILPRLLNVFPSPLIVLRQNVNSLTWGGSLVAGCVAFPRRQLQRDWQKSAWLSRPDFQILYSDEAVFRLLEVAGLKVTRCIRLSDEEVVSFSADSERAPAELASFGRRLFQASGYHRTFGTLLFLLCRRSF